MALHHVTWHNTSHHIASNDVTITWPDPATDIKTSKHFTSKHKTSPPWNGRRLVHSKEMIWASRWSVALRTFYRQILSSTYSFFLWNFRPRLVRALLVLYNSSCCVLKHLTLQVALPHLSHHPLLSTAKSIAKLQIFGDKAENLSRSFYHQSWEVASTSSTKEVHWTLWIRPEHVGLPWQTHEEVPCPKLHNLTEWASNTSDANTSKPPFMMLWHCDPKSLQVVPANIMLANHYV